MRTVFWFIAGVVIEIAAVALTALTEIRFLVTLGVCSVVGFGTALVLEKIFGKLGEKR